MTRKVNMPRVDMALAVLPIENGGTGTNSLAQAATNLNLVTSSIKGMPSGVIPLGADGKLSNALTVSSISSNPVNLDGNFSQFINQAAVYTISDYDSFKTYSVSVSSGTVAISGDTITVTCPAVAGNITLTVNGRDFPITVSVPQPAQPSISTPINGAINQGVSNLGITSSAFVAMGGSFTHQSSDWQIATDAAFTNIVSQIADNTTNKVSWTVPVTLGLNTVYYVRVRYKGSNGNYGAWSATSSFTTKALAEAMVETQSFGQTDFSGGCGFPYFLSISDDGNRVVTSYLRNNGYNMGQYPYVRVAAYHRSNGVWAKVWSVDIDPDFPPNFNTSFWACTFQGARISPDGQRIFTLQTANGPSYLDGGGNGYADGLVNVYTWNGTSYAFEATLTPNTASSYNAFGYRFACNTDGSKVVIASGVYYSESGYTQLFTRSGTNWTRGTKQSNTRTAYLSGLIGNVTMSRDGTRYAVSFASNNGNNGNGSWTVASVYTITGSTSALEANINYTFNLNSTGIGQNCALNSDGSRLLISAYGGSGDTNGNAIASGAIYEVNRSGTTWTDSGNRITNDDATNTERFGFQLKMNAAGNKFIATAPYATVGGVANKGCYYLYEKVGSTWTRRAKVVNSLNVADYLGYFFDATLTLDVAACYTASVAKATMFI